MRKMFAALAAVPFTLTLMSSTASATEEDVVQTFQNVYTGACVDDSSYGLRGYGCNGKVFQDWTVHVWNDGTRQFRSRATGECLYDDGYTLDTRPCNSSREQSWYVDKNNGGAQLQSQATLECLDDSSWGLRTLPCSPNWNTHQRFK
ncbi:RICIN domain-containing protein [Lentzea tibetensis]|uniref:RICIN domain-containing protein n=1 Tax=Lentzea tibetensis TaxID=2591470 RepID=UPI0016449E8C|nr:RICIN domain-containing protein [Lentzea tibetensis]